MFPARRYFVVKTTLLIRRSLTTEPHRANLRNAHTNPTRWQLFVPCSHGSALLVPPLDAEIDGKARSGGKVATCALTSLDHEASPGGLIAGAGAACQRAIGRTINDSGLGAGNRR